MAQDGGQQGQEDGIVLRKNKDNHVKYKEPERIVRKTFMGCKEVWWNRYIVEGSAMEKHVNDYMKIKRSTRNHAR